MASRLPVGRTTTTTTTTTCKLCQTRFAEAKRAISFTSKSPPAEAATSPRQHNLASPRSSPTRQLESKRPPPRPHPFRIIELANLVRQRLSPSSTYDTFSTFYFLRQLNMATPDLKASDQPWRYGRENQKWIWSLPATTALVALWRKRSSSPAGGVKRKDDDRMQEAEARRIMEVIVTNSLQWDLDRAAKERVASTAKRKRAATTSLPPLLITTVFDYLLATSLKSQSVSQPLLALHSALGELNFPFTQSTLSTLFTLQLDGLRRPDLAAETIGDLLMRHDIPRANFNRRFDSLVDYLDSAQPSPERDRAIEVLANILAPQLVRRGWGHELQTYLDFASKMSLGMEPSQGKQLAYKAVDRVVVDIARRVVPFRLRIATGLKRRRIVMAPLDQSDPAAKPPLPPDLISEVTLTALVRYVVRRFRSEELARELFRNVAPQLAPSPNVSNLEVLLSASSSEAVSAASLAPVVNDSTVPALLRSLNPLRDGDTLVQIVSATLPWLTSPEGSATPPDPTSESASLLLSALAATSKAGKVGLAERIFRRLRWLVVAKRELHASDPVRHPYPKAEMRLPPGAVLFMLRMYARERLRPPGHIVRGWGRAALRWHEREDAVKRFPSLRPPRVRSGDADQGSDEQVWERRVAAPIVAEWELMQASRLPEEKEVVQEVLRSKHGKEAMRILKAPLRKSSKRRR